MLGDLRVYASPVDATIIDAKLPDPPHSDFSPTAMGGYA
jgi:hypothetical protein